MPPAGFEPAIPTSERPQTHILGRMATRTGHKIFMTKTIVWKVHYQPCYTYTQIQLLRQKLTTSQTAKTVYAILLINNELQTLLPAMFRCMLILLEMLYSAKMYLITFLDRIEYMCNMSPWYSIFLWLISNTTCYT